MKHMLYFSRLKGLKNADDGTALETLVYSFISSILFLKLLYLLGMRQCNLCAATDAWCTVAEA